VAPQARKIVRGVARRHNVRIPVNNDLSPLADTEVHFLPSAHVGDEFKIFVGHCGVAGTDGADDALPTLYITDANGFFGLVVDIIRSMQLTAHLPPMLVVGVGYRTGVLGETVVTRARDLTPTNDPRFTKFYPEQSATGRAPAFLLFLRDELVPWVESRFAVDRDDRVYFGHSLGGLFGCYAMLREPELFRRLIIGSPSLWWDRRVINEVETAYHDAHDDLPGRVFFGIGSDETHDGRQREAVNQPSDVRTIAGAWHLDMVDQMHQFVARLQARRYPNLDIKSVVFADEFHSTVPQLNFSRGMRWLFHSP
jgi:predicted alpha/beta superfamily hydrolase